MLGLMREQDGGEEECEVYGVDDDVKNKEY